MYRAHGTAQQRVQLGSLRRSSRSPHDVAFKLAGQNLHLRPFQDASGGLQLPRCPFRMNRGWHQGLIQIRRFIVLSHRAVHTASNLESKFPSTRNDGQSRRIDNSSVESDEDIDSRVLPVRLIDSSREPQHAQSQPKHVHSTPSGREKTSEENSDIYTTPLDAYVRGPRRRWQADSGVGTKSQGFICNQSHASDFDGAGLRLSTAKNTSGQSCTNDQHHDGVMRDPKNEFRRKVDLSYHNVRTREAIRRGDSKLRHQAVDFRNHRGLRRLLEQFMAHISTNSMQALEQSLSHEKPTAETWLLQIFNPTNLQLLQLRGYEPEDLVSWSWVLSASRPELRVRRYVLLCRKTLADMKSYPPRFICLQLLRSSHIDAGALRLLFEEISRSSRSADCHIAWDDDSAAIMLVRLLRHARMVDAGLHEDIADFATRVVRSVGVNTHGEIDIVRMRRLTHLYNRLLSLIALPIAYRPFASVPVQQRAQLTIARFMQECKPPIAVNREGYRAFTRLQLMHTKTSDEQQWARVKASSWPPWRRDQLGIQEKVEYQGQRSRAMKVLQRMQESGYGPSSFENAAQIIAGWDTDQSPTIQVRRILARRPMSWLRDLSSSGNNSPEIVDHHLWAARVAATRTVREAWLCFHAYAEATRDSKRHIITYQAMFEKLLARTSSTVEKLGPFPGDGKEVYPDPVSSRDLVYVPSEPPTVAALYSDMLAYGIKPRGTLLSCLLSIAATVEDGCRQLEDSSINDTIKDVLLHAERHPPLIIRDSVRQMHNRVFSAYLECLSRARSLRQREFQPPSSISIDGNTSAKQISPFVYAQKLLEVSESTFLPAYHAILTGVGRRSLALHTTSQDSSRTPVQLVRSLWSTTMWCVDRMREQYVLPRTVTLLLLHPIVQNVAIYCDEPELIEMSSLIKSVFYHALRGKAIGPHSIDGQVSLSDIPAKSISRGLLPKCIEMESMILTYALLGNNADMMELLEWISAAQSSFMFKDARPQSVRDLLAAARVAVEGIQTRSSSEEASLVNGKDNYRLMEIRQSLEWATDEEVEMFLQRRKEWVNLAERRKRKRSVV